MAFIVRLCLLSLLLTPGILCFAMNIPKGNRKSLSLYEIEDYGPTGPNPKHDPHPPPPASVYPKMQISEDDHGRTRPNLKLNPNPPPSPLKSEDPVFGGPSKFH